MGRSLLIAAPLLALASSAAAQGSAEVGKALAQQWCAQCHVIEAEPTRVVVDSAPPFPAVANDPTKTDAYLRTWLFDPHPPMPKLELTRREIDHLVAYIESLRRP